MNIFESTFEKHKKLVLEATTPEQKKLFKAKEEELKKMSPEELTNFEKEQRAIAKDAKIKKDKAKESEANTLVGIAVGIRKSNLAKGKALDPEEFKQIQAKLSDIIDKDYPGFVGELKSAIRDPKVQKFLLSAKKDASLQDDKINIEPARPRCSELQATQNEVFFENSIAKPISNKMFGQIKNYITKGFDSSMPALVIFGQYVVDGHHRWSQAFCWNKNSQMKAYNISFPGADVDEVLKKVQLGIAASVGDVPAGSMEKGTNLFTMGENEFLAKLKETFTPETIAVFKDPEVQVAMKKNLGTPSASSEKETEQPQPVNEAEMDDATYLEKVIHPYMWSNIQALRQKSGKYPRAVMPQTGENEPPQKFIRTMQSGNVNVDVKSENAIFESTFNKFKKLYAK